MKNNNFASFTKNSNSLMHSAFQNSFKLVISKRISELCQSINHFEMSLVLLNYMMYIFTLFVQNGFENFVVF